MAVRSILFLALGAVLIGCSTPNVDTTSSKFSQTTYSSDLNQCRGGNIAEASLKTIGVGVVGSVVGAAHFAALAIHADSAEVAVAGAAIGAAVGIGVGAFDAVKKRDDAIADCLREKGYDVMASAQTAQLNSE